MFVYYLWGFLNDMSMLMNLAMIAIPVPGFSQKIQSFILEIIYLDILQTEKWFIDKLEEDGVEDSSLNWYIEQSGFGSMSLMKNLGSTLIYMGIYAVSFLILLIFHLLGAWYEWALKGEAWLTRQLIWSPIIRFVIQQYQPLVIASIINLYEVRKCMFNIYFCR